VSEELSARIGALEAQLAALKAPPRRAWHRGWTAVLVVVALVLGGGLLTASAAAPSVTSFTAITPCRLFDTRPPTDNVGPRRAPLGAGETYTVSGRGAVGNCNLPVNATALGLNVTIVNPTGNSFLTVFPAGPLPTASNLNWVAQQAPTPNAVTTTLSADGLVSFYNFAGTVDVVVDVVGVYLPTTIGPTSQVYFAKLVSVPDLVSTISPPPAPIVTLNVPPGSYVVTSVIDISGTGASVEYSASCSTRSVVTGASPSSVIIDSRNQVGPSTDRVQVTTNGTFTSTVASQIQLVCTDSLGQPTTASNARLTAIQVSGIN
jgi:hypothetical protein